MMNILAIYSSPKKNSNSTFLLKTIVEELQNSGKHSIEEIDVAKMNIAPCKACNGCIKKGDCVQKDDMGQVKAALAKADYIFMATPLYWWYVSAQLKLMVDRFYAPSCKDVLHGKTIHLVVTGMSPANDIGYQFIGKSFSEICAYLKANFRGFFVSAGDGDAAACQNQDAIAEAKALAAELS